MSVRLCNTDTRNSYIQSRIARVTVARARATTNRANVDKHFDDDVLCEQNDCEQIKHIDGIRTRERARANVWVRHGLMPIGRPWQRAHTLMYVYMRRSSRDQQRHDTGGAIIV